MNRSQNFALLGLVVGASAGALIGLVFIKHSLWWTLVGAILGAPIGVRVGLSGTEAGNSIDEAAGGALGCLFQLWLSTGCIGCWTIAGALIGGLIVGVMLVLR